MYFPLSNTFAYFLRLLKLCTFTFSFYSAFPDILNSSCFHFLATRRNLEVLYSWQAQETTLYVPVELTSCLTSIVHFSQFSAFFMCQLFQTGGFTVSVASWDNEISIYIHFRIPLKVIHHPDLFFYLLNSAFVAIFGMPWKQKSTKFYFEFLISYVRCFPLIIQANCVSSQLIPVSVLSSTNRLGRWAVISSLKWALLIWQMTIKRHWNASRSCAWRLCRRGHREHSLISKYACAHILSAWAVRLMYGVWTRVLSWNMVLSEC